MSEIVPLWKENNVDHAVFTFDCGGDNMGDTEWVFYDKANQPLTVSNDLEQALDNDIYHHVKFYVDSNGHYIGENGTVHVSFDDDEITYVKCYQSEFSETCVTDLLLPLSAEQINFINQHIFNMNGSDTDDIAINYKHDFLMTNEDEVIVRELITAIENACKEHHPDNEDEGGELEEFFTFTTNNEGEDIKITDNQLVIHMSNNFRVYRDSND